MHKEQADPEQAQSVLSFFNWAYASGGKMAQDLDYVPMPEHVVKLIVASWGQIKTSNGAPVWKGTQAKAD
jgi:phosphate transport system substrate-binding protein